MSMSGARAATRACLLLVLAATIINAQVLPQQRKPDVGYVPTSPPAVEAMLRLAEVKKSDVVYDLGCGDGRIVIAAAKNFGARAVGIDIDPVMIGKAKENAKRAGVEHLVRFEQGDLFKADVREATVVTLYLLTSINLRLRPKLVRELKPGTRIVSNTFDMADQWKPHKSIQVGPPGNNNPYLNPTLFLWVVPRSRRGQGMDWRDHIIVDAQILVDRRAESWRLR